tara:strand:- start:607 stop:1977 length:1371 start_codon:yes stop_codon:yes gene_type:complete
MSETNYNNLIQDADKLIDDLVFFEKLYNDSKKNANGRWEEIRLSKINGTNGGKGPLEPTFQSGRAVQLLKTKLGTLEQLIDPTIGLTEDPVWLIPNMDGTYDAPAGGAHRTDIHLRKGMKTIKALVLKPEEYQGREQALSIFSCTENVPSPDSYQVQATTVEDWLQKAQPLYEGFKGKAEASLPEGLSDEERTNKIIDVALKQTERVLRAGKFGIGDPKGKKWAKLARTLKKADMRSMMKFEQLYDKDPTERKTLIKDNKNCEIYKELEDQGAFRRGNNSGKGKTRTAKEHTVNVAGNGQDAKVLGRILNSNMERFRDGLPPLDHYIIGHATEEEKIACPEDLDEARAEWVRQQNEINDYFKELLKTAFVSFAGDHGIEHLVNDFNDFADETQNFIAGTRWLAQHDEEQEDRLYPQDARLPQDRIETREAEEVSPDDEKNPPLNGSTPQAQMTFMQ